MSQGKNEPKKRGRKPKRKSEDDDQACEKKPTYVSKHEHVIQLFIPPNEEKDDENENSDNMYENNFCKYDPNIVEPNPYTEKDSFSSHPFEFDIKNQLKVEDKTVKILNSHLMKDNVSNTLCEWCCHSFDNDYIGLPIKYTGDVFYVIGCYCSFECACADNFYSNASNINIWETYSLLNLMAIKMNYNSHIYPAPSKKCLSVFGGYMNIQDFRDFKTESKILVLNNSPMVAVSEQIEEINDYHHKNKNDVLIYDTNRIDKYEKKLLKENNKNLVLNFKNTLDSTMNISQQVIKAT
jgi:hypothetical protein